MNHERFRKVSEERVTTCLATLNSKGEEYSRAGDRLHNFKKAGRRQGCTPERALVGMWEKHLTSIDDMIEDLEDGKLPSHHVIDEKFTDAINYLLLLEGLLVERMTQPPCPEFQEKKQEILDHEETLA